MLITIGWQGSGRKRPGQIVRATIVFSGGGGEERVSFTNVGKYVNDLADSRLRRRAWRVIKKSLSPGDSIRFDVFTGIKGAGADTTLTGSWVYLLDPTAPVQEVRIPSVGPKGIPLAKGRLVEIAATTQRAQLDDELQQFIDNDEGM